MTDRLLTRRDVREKLKREMRAGSARACAELLFLRELEERERRRTDVGWLPSTEPDPDGGWWGERDITKDCCRDCGRLRGSVEVEYVLDGETVGSTEFPDPCLGLLPGVGQACCGHGRRGAAVYVLGAGFGELRGPAAASKMRELGGDPPAAAFLLDPVTGAS